MFKPIKRNDSQFYWYNFTINGRRFRGSTKTDCYETAKAVIAKIRSEAHHNLTFGEKKPELTFDAATGKYLLEHGQYLKSYKTVDGHCARMLAFFGQAQTLSAIGNKQVNDYVAHRRTQVDDKGSRIVSDTTINRELETLRKIFNLARDKWEVAVGDVNFRQHMLREPEARTRWITHEEAEKLINAAADHIKAPIQFALLTGLRWSNIRGLKWRDVDLKNCEMQFRIKSNIPGGKLLVLPITEELHALLGSLRTRMLYRNRKRVRGKNGETVIYTAGSEDYVFTYRGEPVVDNCRKSFRSACDAAGINDFRWHDLRHTAASWMIQSGVPIDLVQEILGHTQITTTKKYAHRQHDEKRAAMGRVGFKKKQAESEVA